MNQVDRLAEMMQLHQERRQLEENGPDTAATRQRIEELKQREGALMSASAERPAQRIQPGQGVVLSNEEIQALTQYRRPAQQLAELQRQGFYRARRGPVSGRVILERAHYEAVCSTGATPIKELAIQPLELGRRPKEAKR